MPAMLLSEACRWYPSDAAVRAHLVVIPAPLGDLGACLVQGREPVLVQTLVAEPPVEALDVAVLHGPPWLDQDVPDAVALGPGDESTAGELRAVVRPHGRRIGARQGSCRLSHAAFC